MLSILYFKVENKQKEPQIKFRVFQKEGRGYVHLQMQFQALPKIELHLHLDCSISRKVVNKFIPHLSEEDYSNQFVAPPKCHNLADFLQKAAAGIQFLQTEEQLRATVLDLFEQLKADQVWYAEIRFAPLLHTEQGLSPKQVMRIATSALQEGIAQTGIQAGFLLCTLRHYSTQQGLETAKLAEDFCDKGVVGFDIAADEAGFGIQNHIPVFEYLYKKGVPCTAHAGEARGADSMWETLSHFKPQRIGHGVRSVEDPKLLSYLAEKKIHLEVCPTSNIQTNVFESMAGHSLPQLYAAGVPVSINTDGRSLCNVTLSQEYQNLHDQFGWGPAHFLQCNLYAVQAAFAPKALKDKLKSQLLAFYSKLES